MYTVGTRLNKGAKITMKRIVYLVIALVGLWTSMAFANEQQWEYVGESVEHQQVFIDASSVKVITVATNEIAKAKFKTIKGDTKYDLSYYKVNIDTKAFSTTQFESYENGKLVWQCITDGSWNSYDPNNFRVNEVLKRTN